MTTLAMLFLFMGMALAQSSISGTVVAQDDGNPIVGASVRVVGTSTGTVTDINGNFTVGGVTSKTMLEISYIGMLTQRVKPVNGMTVELVTDRQNLDEIIVVAYGTVKKSSFTGAAAGVDAKRIDKMQAADASKALEGMVAGLSVTQESGRAGTPTTLRIRGIGSLNASSAPLIILDGAPYTGDINAINPKDIESVNVLKDAASAALYGARGANGVILITTKTGQAGKVQVNFDARLGSNSRAVPEYDILRDPGTYYKLAWESLKNYQVYGANSVENPGLWASQVLIDEFGGYNMFDVADDKVVDENGNLTTAPIKYEDGAKFNDWMSHLYKPKLRQEYNLSISKGSDKSKLFLSLGYLNDKGFNMKTGFERFSTRMAYEAEITKWLKVSTSTQFAKTTTDNPTDEDFNFGNTFYWTRNIAPIYPVYMHDSDGKIVRDANGNAEYDDSSNRNFSGNFNLIKQTELNFQRTDNFFLTQNGRMDVMLPAGFNFNTTATFNGSWWRYSNLISPLSGDGKSYNGIIEKNPTSIGHSTGTRFSHGTMSLATGLCTPCSDMSLTTRSGTIWRAKRPHY